MPKKKKRGPGRPPGAKNKVKKGPGRPAGSKNKPKAKSKPAVKAAKRPGRKPQASRVSHDLQAFESAAIAMQDVIRAQQGIIDGLQADVDVLRESAERLNADMGTFRSTAGRIDKTRTANTAQTAVVKIAKVEKAKKTEKAPAKKSAGRPKGSKNKVKKVEAKVEAFETPADPEEGNQDTVLDGETTITREHLDGMKMPALRKLADDMNIEGKSRNRDTMIGWILEAHAENEEAKAEIAAS